MACLHLLSLIASIWSLGTHADTLFTQTNEVLYSIPGSVEAGGDWLGAVT